MKNISFGLPHNAMTAFVSFFNMSNLVSITQYNRLHLYPKMYVTCSLIFLLNKTIIMVMTANRSVHISAGFSAGFYFIVSSRPILAPFHCTLAVFVSTTNKLSSSSVQAHSQHIL